MMQMSGDKASPKPDELSDSVLRATSLEKGLCPQNEFQRASHARNADAAIHRVLRDITVAEPYSETP